MSVTSNAYLDRELLAALQMISGTVPPETARLLDIRDRLNRISGSDNQSIAEIVDRIDTFMRDRA